jgi:hypothetical protein
LGQQELERRKKMKPLKHSHCRCRSLFVTFCLALLAMTAARADTLYQIQSIAKSGGTLGDLGMQIGTGFEVGTLNDLGELVFLARSRAGGQVLLHYGNGAFTPIAVPGQDGPVGKWPAGLGAFTPVSMNQSGDVVFTPGTGVGSNLGTFLWEAKAKQVIPIVLKGMPAGTDLTFAPSTGSVPIVNKSGETAFVAPVQNAAGPVGDGVFFLGRDGRLMTVALGSQTLPGGATMQRAQLPSLNDSGLVAFLARPQGGSFSAYLWEKGSVTSVLLNGSEAPDGGKFSAIHGVRINNKNRSVLVAAHVEGAGGDGLYQWADGKLTSLVVPGKEMPGGGRLKNVPINGLTEQGPAVSYANELGQHAFRALLDDGSTAAYLLDADGKLSLILKSGATTSLGTITNVGGSGSLGIGLNSQGQVALAVNIAGGSETLTLLTPAGG